MAPFGGFQDLRFSRLGIAPWKLVLAAAVVAALAITALLIATGIFLVVIPILAVAGLASRLFAGREPPRRDGPPGAGPLIEGDYRVLSSRPIPGSGWTQDPQR
ncbi:MAG TPA: hypothetical protein VHD15_09190 [Hyphomicrobiales bacterium]|nr:hypothetical protein [Hyphomicrobiales bacterium]